MTDKEIDKSIRDEIKQDFKAREEEHQQIEEMNTLMQEAYNNHCENVTCVKCSYFDKQHGKNEGTSAFYCQNYLEADALYNAGYRKESETAKEIFNKLIKIAEDEFKGSLPFGVLKAWALEYGVEV